MVIFVHQRDRSQCIGGRGIRKTNHSAMISSIVTIVTMIANTILRMIVLQCQLFSMREQLTLTFNTTRVAFFRITRLAV
jgi:hypothetical protein